MDFELSDEQKDIKNAAREFAEKEFTEIARDYDQKESFPRDLWRKACGLGFVGLFIKEEYGGPGLGILDHSIVMEEFWRVDPGCGNILLTIFGAEFIQIYGREEQKIKYLPPLPRGEAIMGTAITEPDAGSDITAISTRAKKDRDGYIINGTKQFITNGSIADYLIVICVTEPEAESRFKRFSALLVESNRPGFEAIKIIRSEKSTASIPIIAISAWASAKHKERALEVGANEHFTKPVDLNRLLTTINRYLKE